MYLPKQEREMQGYAAAAGDAMHYAWQSYLRTRDMAVAEATLAIRWPWDHPFAKNNRPYWRALDALREVCDHPVSQYEMVYVDKAGETVPAIELAVCLVVKTATLEIHYTGYIDAVMVDPVSGMPMVVDLKSTGEYMDNWRTKFMYDTQVKGYAIILSALSHNGKMGEDVKGCYLGTYMNSGGDPWTDTVEVDCGRMDSLFFINDLQIFAAQIALYQNADRFPRSAGACKDWGRVCPYMGNLCQLESLTAIQREIDGLRMEEDAKMEEFTPDFTVIYDTQNGQMQLQK